MSAPRLSTYAALLAASVLLPLPAVAQATKAPPSGKPAASNATAGAAPAVGHPCGFPRDTARSADTLTTSYLVSGVRVIHRCVTANDVVAANLYLLGGVRQATPETQGIEPLLLQASERGTRKYPKDVLRRKMATLGSEIAIGPGVDWSVIGLRAIRANFDSTWAILADRVIAPTLDSTEVADLRSQLSLALRQRGANPDALVAQLADSMAWIGHPYALDPIGTEASMANLDVAALKRYHGAQMVTSRMLLVIVGHVERDRVERLVRATIGRLPAGSYAWSLPPDPAPITTDIMVVQRPLPTNYIRGYFQGPAASSPDYQALRVASAALSGRLFGEIRSRRNLTYAVESPFVERARAVGGLYVTTTSPDTVLALMRTEIRDLQTDLVPERGLELLVQQFITEYFLDNETNAAQADFLARAHLFQGDWRSAERFVDELRRVTPQDVRRVARQYMKNIRFAYVGDPRAVSRRSVQGF
jgi:zinc protease